MLLPGRASPARISPGGVTPEGLSPPSAPAPAPAPAPALAPGPVPTPGSAAPRATNGHVNHGTVRDTPAVTRSRATTLWPVPVAARYGGGRNNNRAILAELFEAGTLQGSSKIELELPCYTEDIAHLVEKASFNEEYAYVTTNALGSFLRGQDKKQIPNTFKEAMTPSQAARWKVPSDNEIASLEKHGVYELVPITSVPNWRNVTGTRWVYKIKADGVYKGRLVVLGWSQVPGIDCGGTFAPVCRLQSIRMVLAIAAELNYEIYMLDVQTPFLNADVEEKAFGKSPLGYERSN